MSPGPEPAAEGPATSVAPFADLLFSVTTIIIVVLVALIPAIGPHGQLNVTERARETRALEAAILARERPRLLLHAHDGGLSLYAPENGERREIALDEIRSDDGLRSVLRAAGSAITVMVDEAGQEAFFLLDNLAAREGIAHLRLLRRI